MSSFFSTLSDLDVVRILCMMWAIWRVRNDAVIGGKQQNLFTCYKYYNEILLACQPLYSGGVKVRSGNGEVTPNAMLDPNQALWVSGFQGDPICIVDGSWSVDRLAGIGMYVIINERVVQWVSKRVIAVNAAQAEAIAVLQGLKLLIAMLVIGAFCTLTQWRLWIP